MIGEMMEIEGRTWIPVAVEPMGPESRADDDIYFVSFVDPDDDNQWVSAANHPVGEDQFTAEGLRRLFRVADQRVWCGPDGHYWQFTIDRPVPIGARDEFDDLPEPVPDTISLKNREDFEEKYYTREPRLPVVGRLSDSQLEQLLEDAQSG